VRPLFITATGTNVGKTYTTLQLIEILSAHGIRVGVYKPIETGVTTHAPDATALLHAVQRHNPTFGSLTPSDITAYTFPLPAAPFCADTTQCIEVERLLAKADQLSQLCDLLLIEGAGGLMVPITQTFTMIDLAQALDAHLLLVTPSRLGCINDTLLSLTLLQSRHLSYEWCVNLHEDHTTFAQVTQPYYDKAFPVWWSLQEGLEEFCQNLIEK